MNQEIRWQQCSRNLEKALRWLQEALQSTRREPGNHLYQIALIGAFQCAFELSWKTMEGYLVHNCIKVSLPRDVIKQAFHHKLIQDQQVWIDMLEDRHLMTHAYEEQAALTAVTSIRERYAPAIENIHHRLLKISSAYL